MNFPWDIRCVFGFHKWCSAVGECDMVQIYDFTTREPWLRCVYFCWRCRAVRWSNKRWKKNTLENIDDEQRVRKLRGEDNVVNLP